MISTLLEDAISRIKTTSNDSIEPSQLKALLQSALQKADLVSREEFDAQAAVLMRTRQRVQELEAQLETIEKQLAKHS